MPTQRSVAARQRSRSFEGGRREDSFRSETRIRVFPRNAVTAKNMLSAEMDVNSPCIPFVQPSKHRSCTSVSIFSSTLEFAFTIIVAPLCVHHVRLQCLSSS